MAIAWVITGDVSFVRSLKGRTDLGADLAIADYCHDHKLADSYSGEMPSSPSAQSRLQHEINSGNIKSTGELSPGNGPAIEIAAHELARLEIEGDRLVGKGRAYAEVLVLAQDIQRAFPAMANTGAIIDRAQPDREALNDQHFFHVIPTEDDDSAPGRVRRAMRLEWPQRKIPKGLSWKEIADRVGPRLRTMGVNKLPKEDSIRRALGLKK